MTACLGLFAGLAWRVFLQETRYFADTEVAAGAVSAEGTTSIDWNHKARAWHNLLHSRETRALLDANLRRAVKVAAVPPPPDEPNALSHLLAELEGEREFSASFFHGPFLSRFGPSVTVRRSDIPANLDFQSLAAIVSDLDPSREHADNWDFSFFRMDGSTPGAIIVRPAPDDPYFKVFYHLHDILNGSKRALSPIAAWRTAVAEVAERLEREARYPGGGGFGPLATMELRRELKAIPILAANSLYHAVQRVEGTSDEELLEEASLWRRRWESAGLGVRVNSPDSATVVASMEMRLYPLAFPRDTVYTRTAPQALATLITFLEAWEEQTEEPRTPQEPASPGEDDQVQAHQSTPVERRVTTREVVDEEALRQRQEAIASINEAIVRARLEYGSAMLRLDGAKHAVDRTSRETIATRARLDRQRERQERLLVEKESVPETDVPGRAAAIAVRNAVATNLEKLLETCTEEHPFVKAARRELAAAESALAAFPAPETRSEVERLSGYLARVAQSISDTEKELHLVEARLRLGEEQVAILIDEADLLARTIAEQEEKVEALRALPVPRITVTVTETALPVDDVGEMVEKADASATTAPPPTETAMSGPKILFEDTPTHIPLRRRPPSPAAPLWGMLGGLLAGVIWVLSRGILGSRFFNTVEAERMVGLPVLAALPAYEPRSIRTAAEGMAGRLARSRGGRLQFLPLVIDKTEPPPAARRGAIVPARTRPALLVPLLGCAFLVLAGLLYYRSLEGFARPHPEFRGELPLRTFKLHHDGGGSASDGKDGP